jgi:hypothetical protein
MTRRVTAKTNLRRYTVRRIVLAAEGPLTSETIWLKTQAAVAYSVGNVKRASVRSDLVRLEQAGIVIRYGRRYRGVLWGKP